MCGLFHVLQRNRPIEKLQIEEALATMTHRGPDAGGTALSSSAFETSDGVVTIHAAFGHRRLSILDVHPRSDQPFRRDGKTLVYNGEIYNFRELKRTPPLAGCSFATTGDTEVLFAALAHNHHPDLLGSMSGMWAFSFYDETSGKLFAARDRYGKKPLFYYSDDERLCLSSNIRAILTFLHRRPVMRPEVLLSYLAHGVIYPGDSEETHFTDIKQVPPGGFIEFDARHWRLGSGHYFQLADYIATSRSVNCHLPALLHEAVTSRLVSDRRVGLLLSGGVDSTLILSVMCAAQLQDSVHCFIGETGRSDDASYAKQCVEQLGIRAHIIALRYGALTFERFLRMCLHQEKPFPLLGNSIAMSEMYEAIAGHDVRVVLDGTGGDEIFGGYWDRYYPFAVREALRKRDWDWLWRALRYNGSILRSTISNMAAAALEPRRLLSPVIRHPSFSVQQFCSAPILAARSRDPLDGADLGFDEAIVIDITGGRLGEWLWQNDRNAMMASVENRSPLLDFRLSAFVRTGYAAKFDGPWNKYELRKAFDDFIPLPTQWRRQKQGFRWAARQFYRQNGEEILATIAASKVLPDHVNVASFVQAARRNRRYLTSRLTPRLLCIAGLEQTLGMVA